MFSSHPEFSICRGNYLPSPGWVSTWSRAGSHCTRVAASAVTLYIDQFQKTGGIKEKTPFYHYSLVRSHKIGERQFYLFIYFFNLFFFNFILFLNFT